MLYAYLVCCAGSKGYCSPSQYTISAKTGIGTTSVQGHLKVLAKRQIIEISKRRSRSGHWNNEYTLMSLDNPEVYRDLGPANVPEELPFDIYDNLPALSLCCACVRFVPRDREMRPCQDSFAAAAQGFTGLAGWLICTKERNLLPANEVQE